MIGDNDPFDFDSLDGQMIYLDREIDGYGEVRQKTRLIIRFWKYLLIIFESWSLDFLIYPVTKLSKETVYL